MVMHPHTLEGLRPTGVTDALLERADVTPRAELHVARRTIPVRLSEMDLPDTAFPHLTVVRQMDVEAVLTRALEQRGIEIERGTELVDLVSADGKQGPRAQLSTDGVAEEAECRFLVGCDGSASTVRRRVGIDWVGAPHGEEVVLADLELENGLTPDRLHVAVGREGLAFVFAAGEGARWRLLASRRSSATPDGTAVPVHELQELIDRAGLPTVVTDCRWSSVVRLEHRLASSYRHGGVFLAGDAAHVHSPAGAQGMNTGILDAVNLGWKVALASRASAEGALPSTFEPLLASYEDERRPVGRRVIALARLIFFAEASTSPLAELLRVVAVPLAAPALPRLLEQRRLMAAVVRLLSQGWVRYRDSTLSVEADVVAGGPRAGDRLPDRCVSSAGRTRRLHELTARPGVHVLLERDATAQDTSSWGRSVVSTHHLDDVPGRGVVAVRPDGFVGYRSPADDPAGLLGWLDLICARGATGPRPGWSTPARGRHGLERL
jgi:2-polyprenyl-6-methoxyphenol hydroxylase-like FAD-dependent oxidoreductase